MSKILMFSGSSRKESFNKKLINLAAKKATEQGHEVTLIDLKEYSMLIYDGDLEEENGAPENAKEICKLMSESDSIVISSPEYNGFPSPLLKNVIDWVSRVDRDVYKNKRIAIISASPGGLGGVRGLMQLRMLLNNLNAAVIPQQLSVGGSSSGFDNNGNLTNENYDVILTSIIKELA